MGKRILLFLLTNILVMTVATVVLGFFGVGHGYIGPQGLDYRALAIICLVYGMVGSLISLAISRWMAKKMMGVQLVDSQSQYSGFVQRVHTLARKAGLEVMPEVGVYESNEINAFATGPSKKRSLVAVSSGLLAQMREDEVDGVLAHEIAHIANGDMVTMTLLQGVLNAFVMFLARVAAFFVQNFFRDENGRSSIGGFAYYFIVIVFQIFFGFLASFVIAAFSRYREFRADAGGAKYAGRDKMVAALKRLQASTGLIEKQNNTITAFKISSPKGFFRFLSTHPPLEDRIKALQKGLRA